MSLPLMPGSEPVQVRYKAPETLPVKSDPVLNCQCPVCRQGIGEQEAMVAFYPSAGSTAPPVFNWDIPQREESIGLNQGRIRGRYVESGRLAAFRYEPRWLDAATGQLYDSDGGWTNTVQFSDGAWRNIDSSLIWRSD